MSVSNTPGEENMIFTENPGKLTLTGAIRAELTLSPEGRGLNLRVERIPNAKIELDAWKYDGNAGSWTACPPGWHRTDATYFADLQVGKHFRLRVEPQ